MDVKRENTCSKIKAWRMWSSLELSPRPLGGSFPKLQPRVSDRNEQTFPESMSVTARPQEVDQKSGAHTPIF